MAVTVAETAVGGVRMSSAAKGANKDEAVAAPNTGDYRCCFKTEDLGWTREWRHGQPLSFGAVRRKGIDWPGRRSYTR